MLLSDLDQSVELPEKIPKDIHIENLIWPKANKKNIQFKTLSDFKKVYEDPTKDPKYKYYTNPFKSPKSRLEKDFNKFLNQLDVAEEYQVRRSNQESKQQSRSLPKLESINKAFNPRYTLESTIDISNENETHVQYDHDRAIRNWSKIKSVMKMSVFNLNTVKGSIKNKLK